MYCFLIFALFLTLYKELSQCQAKGTTGFIQAGLSKNQVLLKDSPTVFKDFKFIKKNTDLSVKLNLRNARLK